MLGELAQYKYDTYGVRQVMLPEGPGTIFGGYGTGYLDVSTEHAKRLFDINKLEEAHR
jgi:hypothetical protein